MKRMKRPPLKGLLLPRNLWVGILLAFFLYLGAGFLFAATRSSVAQRPASFIEGRVVWEVPQDLDLGVAARAAEGLGYPVLRERKRPHLLELQVAPGTVLSETKALKAKLPYRRLYPAYRAKAYYTPYAFPSDPLYQDGSTQWNLAQIQVDRAWNDTDSWIQNASYGSSTRSIIAVLDTGIRLTHHALLPSSLTLGDVFWTNPGETAGNGVDDDGNGYVDDVHGWYIYGNTNDLTPVDNHGTAVAGVAKAYVGDNYATAGVCAACKIMDVEIGDPDVVSVTDMAEAILYAVDNQATVINLSWGVDNPGVLEPYTSYAFAHDCPVVAAMGNDGANNSVSPASDADVIAVGALNSDGNRSSYSNYGTWISLAAPVGETGLTAPNFTCDTCFQSEAGTSFAAPQVAAAMAIVMGRNVKAAHAREVLEKTADDVETSGFDADTGWGRLNVWRALASLRPPVNLAASLSGGGVHLTWDPPPTTAFATVKYAVYRSDASSGPWTNRIGETTGPSDLQYTDATGTDGTTYWYLVVAIDAKDLVTLSSNLVSVTLGAVSATPSPTATSTASFSPSPTGSPTAPPWTPTPSATDTQTSPPTSTDTSTATPSPTPSPSATPSASPSPTSTRTSTPTFSPTGTTTASSTETSSPTPSRTPSDTPTTTKTPTETPTPSATLPPEDTGLDGPHLYPNPVRGPRVSVLWRTSKETAGARLLVYTPANRLVYSRKLIPAYSKTDESLDVSSFANGLYYVQLEVTHSSGHVLRRSAAMLLAR